MNNNETFKTLFDINVSDKIKSKVGLSYLSWAYAWGELKKAYPDSYWTVYSRKVQTTETTVLKGNDAEFHTSQMEKLVMLKSVLQSATMKKSKCCQLWIIVIMRFH